MSLPYVVSTARGVEAQFISESDAERYAEIKSRQDAGSFTWHVARVEHRRVPLRSFIAGNVTD